MLFNVNGVKWKRTFHQATDDSTGLELCARTCGDTMSSRYVTARDLRNVTRGLTSQTRHVM